MLKREESLEDVLDAFVASGSGPTHVALKEWIRLYPQYERELTEFVVDWTMMRHLPPAKDFREVDHGTLVLRAMSIVENKLHAMSEKRAVKDARSMGLLEEAKKKGLTLTGIAALTNLSEGIVRKFDLGLIDPATVPNQADDAFGKAFGEPQFHVCAFLSGPPRPMVDARFRAKKGPALPQTKTNFFDAVQEDREMTDEQRAFWLALDPRR